MSKSVFNTAIQNNLSYKIAVGLERITEAYKALLWQHAKVVGLSPIQIQIIIFVAYHDHELCNVSYLAKEFNITKPTISDAVKALFNKGLILKNTSLQDHRRYTIVLTDKGQKLLHSIDQYANPLVNEISKLEDDQQQIFYSVLQQVISGLHKKGILEVQRNCLSCRFYNSMDNDNHYCNLLEEKLTAKTLRLDCPEFQVRS